MSKAYLIVSELEIRRLAFCDVDVDALLRVENRGEADPFVFATELHLGLMEADMHGRPNAHEKECRIAPPANAADRDIEALEGIVGRMRRAAEENPPENLSGWRLVAKDRRSHILTAPSKLTEDDIAMIVTAAGLELSRVGRIIGGSYPLLPGNGAFGVDPFFGWTFEKGFADPAPPPSMRM
jgi:hypothetical protein